MAESGSWSNIKKNGLLSTSALLDLFEIKGEERKIIESNWRPKNVTINHKKYGKAVIRDQKPLPENKLEPLLDNISTKSFYKLLNGKTFFWLSKERLQRLLNARAYRESSHDVLTIDAKKLIDKYEDQIALSRINSGAAIFGVGRRGRYTFQKIKDYSYDDIKKKQKEAIAELAVDYAVPDIVNHTLRVETWKGSFPTRVIWKK